MDKFEQEKSSNINDNSKYLLRKYSVLFKVFYKN